MWSQVRTCAVECKEEVVHLLLVGGVESLGHKSGCNDCVDVGDSLEDTLAVVHLLVLFKAAKTVDEQTHQNAGGAYAVAKLEGLMDTGRGTRGHSGTEDACKASAHHASSTSGDARNSRQTVLGGQIHLHGGVAAAVVDAAGMDLEDLGLAEAWS